MAARIAMRHAICRSKLLVIERSLKNYVYYRSIQNQLPQLCLVSSRVPGSFSIHTTARVDGLDEFIEDKKYWGQGEVKCGRPWREDELRIKSNEDLHKLWYVLLKERNKLLTMEHECNRQCQLFPSPERIDKVEESMGNLLSVVDERNEAYNLLETGKTGKPDVVEARNFLGIKVKRRVIEHVIPPYMNVIYKAMHPGYKRVMGKYLQLYYEKIQMRKSRALRFEKNRKEEIRKRFPNADTD